MKLKAATSSYVVLTGVWGLLFIGYVTAGLLKNNADLIWCSSLPLFIGAAFGAWLSGFKLTLTDRELIYRDGLYINYRIPLARIIAVNSNCRIRVGAFFNVQPQVLVEYSDGMSLLINPKPFPSRKFGSLCTLLSAHAANYWHGSSRNTQGHNNELI